MLQGSLNAVRSLVESELADSLMKVAEDRRIAEEKLNEVIKLLKSFTKKSSQNFMIFISLKYFA